jgi:hypothetical protein
MSHRKHLAVPGFVWHGRDRSPCFYAEQDYQRYLGILGDQVRERGFRYKGTEGLRCIPSVLIFVDPLPRGLGE